MPSTVEFSTIKTAGRGRGHAGVTDSNLRDTVLETAALPLSYTPMQLC